MGTMPVGHRRGILVASRFDEDLISLLSILDRMPCNLHWCPNLAEAVRVLGEHSIEAVLCDRTLADGDWRDVLGALSSLGNPPPLIVVDQLAEEEFCAEVSRLGAFDVLSKPYDSAEVRTALTWAWEWWERKSLHVAHAAREVRETRVAG